MKRIEIHPSVYLAWSIANVEACESGFPRIEPAHFLLATLIIIDGVFGDVAESMNLSPETVRGIFDVAAQCRLGLHMSDDEITIARRGLRRSLREKGEPLEPTALHRSGESRYIFQRAGRRTFKADANQLTLAHLLEEIIEHMPPDAQPFFKSAPLVTSKDLDEWPDYIVDDTRA